MGISGQSHHQIFDFREFYSCILLGVVINHTNSLLLQDESEFSPLNNSWAETVEKDTKLTERLIASCKADRSRKSANPKKVRDGV